MINISLIDFNGIVENGISATFVLTIHDETYEILFWFNKQGQYHLVIDDEFLENYNYKSIYDIEYFDEMLAYIMHLLPPLDEIFKEFNI